MDLCAAAVTGHIAYSKKSEWEHKENTNSVMKKILQESEQMKHVAINFLSSYRKTRSSL